MNEFARRVLHWFDRHGRHDLPWQGAGPYAVWVSEIMLQQTQVSTVIPYFERFMARFPDIPSLAAADEDTVLHHWSGLGYYARARNLHRAARELVARFDGRLPDDIQALQALPGIGRSTAGAILSLAHGQRQPILDGNVKRVLARHQAIEGWPGQAGTLRELWALSETLTPEDRCGDFNQAMMDLGATLCTRAKPRCEACPLAGDCRAHIQGRQGELPTSRPRKPLPLRRIRMLLLRDPAGRVLLQKRPAQGLWGGLWGLPELAPEEEPLEWCRAQGLRPEAGGRELPPRRHAFTHFRLEILPREIPLQSPGCRVMDGQRQVWYNLRQPDARGLAAPVARLLQELESEESP